MKLASALFLTLLSSGACAADIASCSNPSGKGYYPEKGIISAQDSGWEDERITNGITKLVRQADGGYDILFVDVRNEIVSALQDGALVVPLNRGEDVFSVRSCTRVKPRRSIPFSGPRQESLSTSTP